MGLKVYEFSLEFGVKEKSEVDLLGKKWNLGLAGNGFHAWTFCPLEAGCKWRVWDRLFYILNSTPKLCLG